MVIHLNPLTQAEVELKAALPAAAPADMAALLGIITRAVEGERRMMGEHGQCGAENPEGKAALCKCYCHKGHYKHAWEIINKTPQVNPDGVTYHILARCKYCPDVKLKIIKAGFVKEKHQVVSLEYLIRGEQRVLWREDWLERRPEPAEGKLVHKGTV